MLDDVSDPVDPDAFADRLAEVHVALGPVAREHALMGRVGGDLTTDQLDATPHVLGHMLAALDQVDQAQTEESVQRVGGRS